MTTPADTPENREKLAERLASDQDGILEKLAEEHGVSLLDAIRLLPRENRVILPGDRFEAVMAEATGWGEVLFIVHTPTIVFECKGRVPPGSVGRGYFNLHGPDTPIGGHIRADRCAAIALVKRPFMGRPSVSVQFLADDGTAIFKIFAGRNAARELDPEQIAKMDATFAALGR